MHELTHQEVDPQKVLSELIAIRDDLKISLAHLPMEIQEPPLTTH